MSIISYNTSTDIIIPITNSGSANSEAIKDAINEIDFETDIKKNSLALSTGFEEIDTICKDAVILMISDGIFFPPIGEDDIKLSQDLAIEIKNHNNCTTSNLITSNRIFTILTNDRESVNDFEGLATNQFANYKIYEHGEDDDAISLLANNIVNNICVPNISVTPTKTLTPTVTPTITDTPAASTIPRVLIEEPHTIQFQNTNTFFTGRARRRSCSISTRRNWIGFR